MATALARLRRLLSNSELADCIPAELHRVGFDRILFSAVHDNTWWVRSAYVADDAELADALVRVGQAYPRRLADPLPEHAMLHQDQRPILIREPQTDPRVFTELAVISRSNSYVAAPVYAWQTPVALLHADIPAKAGGVDSADRDLLGLVAEGIGAIFERNLLVARVQLTRLLADEHNRRIWSLSEPFEPDERDGSGEFVVSTDIQTTHRAGPCVQLTPRECEVLDLLAAGHGNAEIAIRLFVSQSTVKSHVSRVLRKLQAGNRTDAVRKYRQLVIPPNL